MANIYRNIILLISNGVKKILSSSPVRSHSPVGEGGRLGRPTSNGLKMQQKLATAISDIWLNRNEGTIAFVLHRLTGLCLVGYIFLHLIVVGSDFLIGNGVFNKLMGFFETPLIKILEICLISVITFHLINGLRIIIIDFFIGAKKQRTLSWVVLVLCILFFIITVLVFLPHIIKQ